MRIERLEIAGFKSFAEPVALEFGRGATAVVGPNGCGKSNIADAVFWVLGELGAGTIRARGKELIFSGSALREPLGVAEVRLHVSGVRSPGRQATENGAAGNGSGWAPNGNGHGYGAGVPVESLVAAAHNGAPAAHPPEPPFPAPDSTREVIVSRRVDASGLSTYEMDGRRCTRKEIQRLFAGTGLGPGSYALIEQGRANEVLSRKPDDLRLLVEEAVGLGAYRLNRRESEANLRAAEKALERVRERLGELDRYIRIARRDSRTASRVREAADRARLLGIAEQAARREVLLARIRENTGPEQNLDAERRRRSQSLSAFERFGEKIRQRATETETELREATRRIGELGARKARAAALLDEGERAAAGRASQVSRLDAEAKALGARLKDLEVELRESARRAGQFPALLEELTQAAEDRATAREAAATRESEAQSAVWELRREADRLRARLGALGLSREQYALRRERLAAARLGLAGARRELQARRAHADRVHSETAAKVQAQEAETTRLRAELDRAGDGWREAAAEAAAARDQEARAERDLTACSARLRSLRALVRSREQLGEGATSLVEAAERLGLPLGGAVGECVAVDPGYERAAERLVGIHRVRIERVADVPGLVKELGGDDAGPGEVVVSELLEAFQPPERPPADGNDRLGDHVSLTDPELGSLGSVVPEAEVAADLPAALAGFLTRPGLYVTRTGDIVAPPGIVRFGRGEPGEGFLTTRREVAELEVKEEEGTRLLARLSQARAAVEEAAERAANALEELRIEHRQAENRVGSFLLESARHGESAENAGKRLEELAAEVSRNAEEVARNAADEARVTTQFAADEARLEETSGGLAERGEALGTAKRELVTSDRGWREADRELTRRKAVATEVAGHARGLERQAEEGRRRLERIGAEHVAASAEEGGWRARRESALAEQAAADAGTREWQAGEGVLAEAAGTLRVRLQDCLEVARVRGTELRAVEERLLATRSGIQEARSLLRELESEFRRANGRALEEEVAALPSALLGRSREEIAEELQGVREQIEKLGPVNEIAEVRLRDLEAERREPESHLRDVECGIADGLRAIRRQDREARRIFREGFDAVSAGFGEAFRHLFGGGRAELRLVEPKKAARNRDPEAEIGDAVETKSSADVADQAAPEQPGDAATEAWGANGIPAAEVPADAHFGVEIAAQPPGKKLQNVRLLSGGEKAMTAIAFLIALFRYRPAPFCLLDEVDAALDDANVQRFAAMLGELKRDTQLVVITHNRLTMEACEHLFGVTMEEPGVSRLISVQLGDGVESWIAGGADSGAGGRPARVHA